ncbi:hypothetical protein LSTR_LSTR012981 [Laodelphax striatellus]|uniref:Uncharacterized protein n=1 Tax=Laodelphax striatellus TaxID=195883 RepID=A0A482XLJ3_LAOST|nr:hypothetical protein LSTR_LSTR012981 [Laodelphax striatellus]
MTNKAVQVPENDPPQNLKRVLLKLLTFLSDNEDDVPCELRMKQKTAATSPSRRSNRLDRDIAVNNGLENESEPSGILIDCISITKQRNMETTPASGSISESSHENSRRISKTSQSICPNLRFFE